MTKVVNCHKHQTWYDYGDACPDCWKEMTEEQIVQCPECRYWITGQHECVQMKSLESDPVNKPSHYTDGDVECVDGCRSALTEDEFRGGCKQQALQYIWRERLKGSDQDLRKAIWWLRMAVGDDPRRDR